MDLILQRFATAAVSNTPSKVIEQIEADIGAVERTRIELNMRQRTLEKKYYDAEEQYIVEISSANTLMNNQEMALLPGLKFGSPPLTAASDSIEIKRSPLVKFLGRGLILGLLAAIMIALTLQNFKFDVAQLKT
jgi:hypothetical protein